MVRCFTVASGSRLLPHGGNYRPGPSRVAKRTGGLRTGTKPAVHPFRRRRHGRMSRANVGGFMRIKLLSPAPRVDRADGDQIGSRTTQSGAAAASGLPHKAGIQTSSDPCERLSASKTFAFPNRPLCRSPEQRVPHKQHGDRAPPSVMHRGSGGRHRDQADRATKHPQIADKIRQQRPRRTRLSS